MHGASAAEADADAINNQHHQRRVCRSVRPAGRHAASDCNEATQDSTADPEVATTLLLLLLLLAG